MIFNNYSHRQANYSSAYFLYGNLGNIIIQTRTHTHTLTHTHTHTQNNKSTPWKAAPHPHPAPLYNTWETKSLKWRNKQNKQKYTRWKKRRDNKGKVSLVDCPIPPLCCIFFLSSCYFICLLPGHSLHFPFLIVVIVCVFQILVILKWFRLLLWSHLESERSQSFGSYFD